MRRNFFTSDNIAQEACCSGTMVSRLYLETLPCLSFEKLHQLLIDLARGLKYFHEVKLTHGGDEDQVNLKYMKFQKAIANHKYLCTTALTGLSWIFFLYRGSNKIDPCHIILSLFCLKKDPF